MNIWTGLLFLDGAIADPQLARALADAEPVPGTRDGEAVPRSSSTNAEPVPTRGSPAITV